MRKIPLSELGISQLLPPDLRAALMDCENWPPTERMRRIEKLTDEAARRGLARERSDLSMEAQWRQARGAA